MVKRSTFSSGMEYQPKADTRMPPICQGGIKMDMESYHELIVKHQAWAYDIAFRKYLGWNIRNAVYEAEETVQNWNVELLSHPHRYDPTREFPPFGFRILHRGCIAVLKRELKNRFLASYEDPAHEKATWLEATVETQSSEEIKREIGKLPQKLRIAVERWLVRSEANEPKEFSSKQAGRQFHNQMYRARKVLKKILLNREKGGSKKTEHLSK